MTSMDRSTTFTLSERDMLNAGRRYVFFSMTERRTVIRLGLVWLVGLAVGVAVFMVLGGGRYDFWRAMFPALMFATIGVILVPLAVPLITLPFVVKRRFRQDAMLRRPLFISWSDTHYRVETEGVTNNLLWADYSKWCEDKSQFLFFLSDYNYQILPKRVLSMEQIADLRAAVIAARG